MPVIVLPRATVTPPGRYPCIHARVAREDPDRGQLLIQFVDHIGNQGISVTNAAEALVLDFLTHWKPEGPNSPDLWHVRFFEAYAWRMRRNRGMDPETQEIVLSEGGDGISWRPPALEDHLALAEMAEAVLPHL